MPTNCDGYGEPRRHQKYSTGTKSPFGKVMKERHCAEVKMWLWNVISSVNTRCAPLRVIQLYPGRTLLADGQYCRQFKYQVCL